MRLIQAADSIIWMFRDWQETGNALLSKLRSLFPSPRGEVLVRGTAGSLAGAVGHTCVLFASSKRTDLGLILRLGRPLPLPVDLTVFSLFSAGSPRQPIKSLSC